MVSVFKMDMDPKYSVGKLLMLSKMVVCKIVVETSDEGFTGINSSHMCAFFLLRAHFHHVSPDVSLSATRPTRENFRFASVAACLSATFVVCAACLSATFVLCAASCRSACVLDWAFLSAVETFHGIVLRISETKQSVHTASPLSPMAPWRKTHQRGCLCSL